MQNKQADNLYWANITLSVTAGVPVEIALAVPVVNCGQTQKQVAACNTLATAQRVLGQLQGGAGADLLRSLHSTRWTNFWNQMQVSFFMYLSRSLRRVFKTV